VGYAKVNSLNRLGRWLKQFVSDIRQFRTFSFF
jgi:hypothetical protein